MSWKLGSPSRNRMRLASLSACFISSIDSSYSFFSSFFRPQLPAMRECRKYWLIEVSSFLSARLRNSRTLASPRMGLLQVGTRARAYAPGLAADLTLLIRVTGRLAALECDLVVRRGRVAAIERVAQLLVGARHALAATGAQAGGLA